MKLLFAVVVGQLFLSEAALMRGGERALHSGSHNDTIFPNGTVVINGHFEKNPGDPPASITWTGAGNKPNNNQVQSDLDLTCFSGLMTVETPLGSLKMKDLQIGDRVLAGGGKYESVYAFAHYDPSLDAQFVSITTFPNHVLELTPVHLVFLEGSNNPIRADAVQVGDFLRGAQEVTKIGTVQREGVYAPLTSSGTIFVSGVLSSNYIALQETSNLVLGGVSTSLSHHDYIHTGLAPFRLYCGLSVNFCKTYNEDGMPPFVSFGIWLSRWAFARSLMVQALFLVSFFLIAGLCCFLETSVGFSGATVLYLAWYRKIELFSPAKGRLHV